MSKENKEQPDQPCDMRGVGNSLFSHFEDDEGNKYHLNGHDCQKGEISFIFIDGDLRWYIDVDLGFDIPLKLIPK